MTDTTRDLIRRLADELTNAIRVIHNEDGTQHISTAVPVLDEARAYLSQPEPEGLTDDEILKISDQFDIDGTEDVTKGMPLDTFWDSYQPQQLISSARTILATDRARCNRPAVEPVPEGPTDEELEEFALKHGGGYFNCDCQAEADILTRKHVSNYRAVLARWGRPTTQEDN